MSPFYFIYFYFLCSGPYRATLSIISQDKIRIAENTNPCRTLAQLLSGIVSVLKDVHKVPVKIVLQYFVTSCVLALTIVYDIVRSKLLITRNVSLNKHYTRTTITVTSCVSAEFRTERSNLVRIVNIRINKF